MPKETFPISEVVAAYRQGGESDPNDALFQIYGDCLPDSFNNIAEFIQWLQDAKQATEKLGLSSYLSDRLRQTLILGAVGKLEPAWAKIFGDWIGLLPKDWETFLDTTVFEEEHLSFASNPRTALEGLALLSQLIRYSQQLP